MITVKLAVKQPHRKVNLAELIKAKQQADLRKGLVELKPRGQRPIRHGLNNTNRHENGRLTLVSNGFLVTDRVALLVVAHGANDVVSRW